MHFLNLTVGKTSRLFLRQQVAIYLPGLITRLPQRFHYFIHNLISHPLSELFEQFGRDDLSTWVHDSTLPR